MTRIAVTIVAFVLFFVGVTVVGWQVYKYNLDQQNQANHTSQQYQDGLIAAERDRVQGYQTAVDEGQKKQILLTYCAVYPSITHPENAPDLVSFTAAHC